MRSLTLTSVLVFVIDQITKYWVLHVMNLDRVRSIDLLPPWLNLRMAWNQGVNFGLMSSDTDIMRWVLIAVAVAVCVWVWLWVRRGGGLWAQIAAGLLIGGALGNVVDRVAYGAVADFLNMSLPNWSNPYSFNVADIAIFAGALGLVVMPARSEPPPAPARKTRAEPAVKRKPRAPRAEPPVTKPSRDEAAKPRDAGKPLR